MNDKTIEQLAGRITSPDQICSELDLDPKHREIFDRVNKEYPFMVTPYYFSLISKEQPEKDSIFKQVVPSISELNSKGAVDDPLSEEEQMPVPGLIHRYMDRVVLLTTNRCSVYCRFCFRKRKWKSGEVASDISDFDLDKVKSYLEEHPEVREVLVSGGDPLMLENDRLDYILSELTNVPSIDIIRIGTRIPVTMPMRIDDELIKVLCNYDSVWVMTHFNHPSEITDESTKACRLLVNAGIPVLNQTVLLEGVNDSCQVLENLFRQLIKIKVKPHYLFHVDPVKGVCHFSTGIDKGIEVLRYFRNRLSSLAVPTFALDLPQGGGKVALQANYRNGDSFLAINGDYISY